MVALWFIGGKRVKGLARGVGEPLDVLLCLLGMLGTSAAVPHTL